MDEILSELTRLFEILNQEIFNNELILPPISIDFSKICVFRFVPQPLPGKSEKNHFIIGAKFIKHPLNNLPIDFVHEMVHLLNHRRRVVDCSANQYHNRHFRDVASEIGLYVKRHAHKGWAITLLDEDGDCHPPKSGSNQKLKNAIRKTKLNFKIINAAQQKLQGFIHEPKRKSYFLKYVCQCPPPHNSIRSGRGPEKLKAFCQDCESPFVKEEN